MHKASRKKQHFGMKVIVPLTPEQKEAVEKMVKTGVFTRESAERFIRELSRELEKK